MKIKFLSLCLSLFATVVWAQEVEPLDVSESAGVMAFGYFSYEEVFQSIPEYKTVKANLENLSNQFKAEADRSEAEFNKKYEAFLDEQRDLAPSILKKRQAELQDMMERNIAFKEESQRLLAEAENEGYAPLKAKIATVLNKIGKEQGLAFILNTDNNTVPYIDSTVGVDITMLIKRELLGGRNR